MNKERLILYSSIILLLVLLVVQCSKEPDTIEIPIIIEVPIPVVEVEFDTIKDPYPIYIPGTVKIDSTYYNKYISLRDSISRDSLFKEAIAIREYREVFEDDTIKIDVYSNVQGFLKKQQVSYKTKPRSITVDTTITVKTKYQTKFGAGIEVGIPTNNATGNSIVVKPKILLDTKRFIYDLSWDTDKRVWAGISFKF